MVAVRTPSGVYLVTVPGCGCLPDTQLMVDTAGRVTDLSGAAVMSSDVVIVQGELRAAGALDIADQVGAWWRTQP